MDKLNELEVFSELSDEQIRVLESHVNKRALKARVRGALAPLAIASGGATISAFLLGVTSSVELPFWDALTLVLHPLWWGGAYAILPGWVTWIFVTAFLKGGNGHE